MAEKAGTELLTVAGGGARAPASAPRNPPRDETRRTAEIVPPTATSAPSLAAKAGFSARLQGATLFDLIQFECLEGVRKIVRVADGPRVGFLYFRGGNVVHASCENDVGEAAVRALLGWQRGVFETCEGQWPTAETITLAWQNLLLRAAQERDEATRGAPPVSPLPTRGPTTSRVLSFPAKDGGVRGDDEVTSRMEVPGSAQPAVVSTRLDAHGAVVGGDAPAPLTEVVAYTAQMADLVGELLGLDGFATMEFTLSDGACVITRESAGGLAAARGGLANDLPTLRAMVKKP